VRPTRPAVLVAIVVVVTALTWIVIRPVYSSLPAVPWTAIPTLLMLALAEGYTGWMTRARIHRRPGTRPVEPLSVARLAALAKASSYTGAVFAGIFGGFVVYVSDRLEQETPLRDFFIAGGSFLSCVVLIAAALYLEFCCRIPEDRDEDDGSTPAA
jgi:hypothetical protein